MSTYSQKPFSSVNPKGTIAILTGGGDVPGLNPAIRAVTIRAIGEGYRVLGIRRGWSGLSNIRRERGADNSRCVQELTTETVRRVGRTGGTFLHSSRTLPSRIPAQFVPTHLVDTYGEACNDLTPEVLKNLEFLGIDTLIAIGGDDTLGYAVRLHKEGLAIIGIPKTMDNDVPGTDYCIGFSTCVTRVISLADSLRTTAGSHERFLVMEVFGRYAGFTALLPTLAGAADRCVIPEHTFHMDDLCRLLVEDRLRNPSRYAVVLVSEGATFHGQDMVFEDTERDMFGHAKLGGIGELVARQLKRLSPRYGEKQAINCISQKLGYLVRAGEPDSLDSIVPLTFGNLALDLILSGISGRLVVLCNGRYGDKPIEEVTSHRKLINVEEYYHTERLRPLYKSFHNKPFMLLTGN
ncbi:MAG TPA: ATP-dependent 6-phosphofructokinase [Candidatus Aminicenantes bacterium]|nr:ATP-dependent 6-phosphofructokinase [Candidatus Aminicenantes bacterium]